MALTNLATRSITSSLVNQMSLLCNID
jgi:hypothetical protein